MKHLLGIIVALGMLLGLAAPARALIVREKLWGFEGRLVADRFNPIWIEMENPSDQMFKGIVTLRDKSGAFSAASLSQAIVISPGSRRWVEFIPHLQGANQDWVLEWQGTERGSESFDPVQFGAASRVAMVESSRMHFPVGIKGFPEERFPASVTDLDTLDSVVLDHQPLWEPLQRQAFVAWLSKGGTVHVARDREGKTPEFQDELGVLNGPLDRFTVGSGLVVRHDLPRSKLNDDVLSRAGFPPPVLATNSPYGTVGSTLGESLREFTQPDHNWFLILGLSAVYLCLIGPVNWLFSRRIRGYGNALLFLLVTIGVFAGVFFITGRRGFGEAATTYTLSEAHPVAGQSWDVTQWSSVFVTSGGDYPITHASPHNLYATARETDPVSGEIHNGKDGAFLVNIPLYSWRELVHRGQFPAPYAFTASAVGWTEHRHSGQLTIQVGEGFPGQTLGRWALVDGQIKSLGLRTDGSLVEGGVVNIDPYRMYSRRYGRGGIFGRRDESPRNQAWMDEQFRDLAQTVMMRDAPANYQNPYAPGNNTNNNVASTPSPLVHLYVLVHAPESLAITTPGLGREVGYVLIHQIIRLPEDSP